MNKSEEDDDKSWELKFIQDKIKRRECICFIEEPKQDSSVPEDDKLCGCGYPRNMHSWMCTSKGKWEYKKHTETLPTNAFGEVKFVGFGDKVGKYVRVDVDTDMKTMLNFLKSVWKMETPNLLISVTGGAKNFTMNTRLREVFRRGLMKAALSTGAWIVTGGTNTGVMKLVGEAARDYGLTIEGRVITIGIASWGCVQSKDQLISEDGQGKWPASYIIDSKEKPKESFLDPNHTHFILVDNGTQHKFTVEIPFRDKLEKAIAAQEKAIAAQEKAIAAQEKAIAAQEKAIAAQEKAIAAQEKAIAAQETDTRAGAVSVPICLLVLEGGPGTLETVHEALNSGTPTVVIKGSGKAADILAYAYQNARENHSTVKDQSGAEKKETNYVLEAHVIADIKEMIKTHFGESNLDKRIEWVKDCCSKRDLLSVFELDSDNSAKDVDLAFLKALLKGVIQSKDKVFTSPAQELFFRAVLMNNHRLSKLFWKEGRESLTAKALFASSILNSMKNFTSDAELRQKLQANSDDFTQLAIGVINKCYSIDEKRTHDLLTQVLPQWGQSTCMFLAVQSSNKEFVAQTACQSLLNSIWMGRMAQGNSLLWIIPSTFFFPLIQFAIKFLEKEKETTSKETTLTDTPSADENGNKDKPTAPGYENDANSASKSSKSYSIIQKHLLFYHSPVVKCILNVISYFIFLLLYSYILVVQLSKEFHFLEGILIGWVFTIFLEEIRQLLTGYAFSFKSYIKDSWNILDIITIVLFAIGMTLRFFDDDYCMSAARVILSINFIACFFRILHIFSAVRKLGPKLIMINRMIQDLISFVIILIVFVVTYAISSEAVLYPNSEFSWKLFYYLPRKAYWQIYGELFLDDIEGNSDCTDDPELYRDYKQLRCPSPVGKYFVPVLLGVYILMTNVLLLNLLIAMFSYTFEQVQEKTDMHWCFQRFSLVYEYTRRPVLPPPLNIFSHMWTLITKICFKTIAKEEDEFRKDFGEKKLEETQLMQWENVIAESYLSSTEMAERNSIAEQVKSTKERLDELLVKVEKLQEGQVSAAKLISDIDKIMGTLENQSTRTTKALEWIMSSLRKTTWPPKQTDQCCQICKSKKKMVSDGVNVVSWQTVSSSLPLHGAHSFFLKLVAKKHNAAF